MKSVIFSLIALVFAFNSFSQSLTPEVIASSGDYYETGNVSLSWTLGECVIETFQSSNAILTQGFHQTKLTVTEIETTEDENYSFLVYPNPANNLINIEQKGQGSNKLSVELFDINGKMIIDKNFNSQTITIDISTYPAAYYILNVQDDSGRKLGSYKILKQN